MRRQWQKNTPSLLAISVGMPMRLSYASGIAWCSMSRAILEASGCRHWATNRSVSPRWLPGRQANKRGWKNIPTLLAVSMAMALRQYVTVHITQWRGSRASLKATGCHHWASTHFGNIKGTYLPIFWCFSLSTWWKRLQIKRMAPINNRGVTYQTDGKHLNSLI